MGLPDNYNPKAYFCEQCKPENHVNTVEALNAGEKPNVVAARHRKGPRTTHQKKAGRKSQGARQSTGGEVLQAPLQADPVQQSTAPPVLSEQNKRKQVAEDSAQVCGSRLRFQGISSNTNYSLRSSAKVHLRSLMRPRRRLQRQTLVRRPASTRLRLSAASMSYTIPTGKRLRLP